MEIERVKKKTKNERVKKKTKNMLVAPMILEQYEEEDTNAEEILRGIKSWAGKIALTNDGEEHALYVKNPYAICEICSKQFEDEEAYQIHITSKRHRRNIQDTLKDKMRIFDEQIESHKLQSKETRELYKYTTQEPDKFECKDHKKISAGETVSEINERYTKNISMDELISLDILKEAFARIDLQINEMIESHKKNVAKSDESEDKYHEKITQDSPLQSLKEVAAGLAKSEDSDDKVDGKITQGTSEDSEDDDDGKIMQYTSEDSEEDDDGNITQGTSLQRLKAAAAGLAKSEDSEDEDDGEITQDPSLQRLEEAAARLHIQVKKFKNSHKITVTKNGDSEFEDHEKITKKTKTIKIPKCAPVLQ